MPAISPALSTRNMVATSHPLATVAAPEVLGAGGNAVDAALAAAAVTWVVLPMMCGPAGDAYALVWDPRDGEVPSIGGGGQAPLAATSDWFEARGHRLIPLSGPLSVGVPGGLGAMAELSRRFGRLPFNELFHSARGHAERGVVTTEHVASHLAGQRKRIRAEPETDRIFGAMATGAASR